MTKFVDAFKRYSGYTRFVAPYWAKAVQFAADHPRTMIGLLAVAVVL